MMKFRKIAPNLYKASLNGDSFIMKKSKDFFRLFCHKKFAIDYCNHGRFKSLKDIEDVLQRKVELIS